MPNDCTIEPKVRTILGRLLPLSALLLLFFAAGCDSSTDPVEGDPNGDPEASTLIVYLTDAPGDVADVWVEISDVRLVGQGQPRSLLDERTGLISLLDLQDTEIVLIDETEVEPGTYSQLRLVIDAAVLETVDGQVYALGGAEHPDGLATTGDLHCPSCGQSGLKVNFAGGFEVGEGRHAALVDFDVSQSFGRQAGQSGRWVMHPVIQGVVTDPGQLDASIGTISGEVVLGTDGTGEPVTIPACGGQDRGLEHFIPLATSTTLMDDESEPFTFAGSTDSDGNFEMTILQADSYSLDYRVNLVLEGEALQWDAEVSPATVDVSAGQTTSGVVYTINSVTCVESD